MVQQKGVRSVPEHTRGSLEFGSRAESFPVDCRHTAAAGRLPSICLSGAADWLWAGPVSACH